MESSLKEKIDWVDEFLEGTREIRTICERCRDYFDNKQWTPEEIRALKKRKQPVITTNRIKPKVQFLLGMEARSRTDPRAFPRTPGDEQSADFATDALRFVHDENNSGLLFSDGFKDFLIEGTQAHEVIVEQNNGRLDVVHNMIGWDRIFYDPCSRNKNFSDARWLGTFQWMDRQEVLDTWPGTTSEKLDFSETDDDATIKDQPKYIDANRNRVRVFFCYHVVNGVWHYCIFTKGGYIKPPVVSPYLDENGKPEPQFVFRSAFIDRENNRYGEVRAYLDIQDEINKRASKALHLVSVRQTYGNKGAVGDAKGVKDEMAKPDGHIEMNIGEYGKDFGIIPTTDMAMAQFRLLEIAKNEIDSVGANAAMSGTDERNMSGKAVMAIQQGGTVELGPLFDGHKQLKNAVYRMMWNRIKQFWTEERWVRVTDDENSIKFVGLNRQVTLEEQIMQEFGGVPPQLQGDPRLKLPVGVENQVADIDVDILIDDTPDAVTLQAEQFELLVQLYQANPQAVPFELVIEASQLRNKAALLAKIKGGTPEQQAALQQMQQQEQEQFKQLEIAKQTMEIHKGNTAAMKNVAAAKKLMTESKKTVLDTTLDHAERMYGHAQGIEEANSSTAAE